MTADLYVNTQFDSGKKTVRLDFRCTEEFLRRLTVVSNYTAQSPSQAARDLCEIALLQAEEAIKRRESGAER